MPILNHRIVGQSAKAKVPRLLSQVPEPRDIHAPPLDTDDDSETLSDDSSSQVRKHADSGSKASSRDITKVNFEASKSTSGRRKGSPLEKKKRLTRGNGSKSASSGTLKTEKEGPSDFEDDEDSDARQSPVRSSMKRSRSSQEQPADGSMDHILDIWNRPKPNKTPGYGKKAILARKVKPRKRELIVPDVVSPGPGRKPRGLILPSQSPSPEKAAPKRLRLPSMSPTPERKVEITAAALFDSPTTKRHESQQIGTESEFDSSQPWPEAPDEDDDLMGDLVSKSISKAEETCPMCYQPVDRALLREFSNGKTLTMRQQMKFCNLHKLQSAKDTWQKRGYPSIEWSGMNRRLKRHHRLLRQIIDGEESHFRKDLAEKLATGQERTLRKTERSLAPGYYGNRGLRLMSEHIIEHFSERLREKAVDDQVISGRGTTVFVSKVLVPELATRLIMEDMSVGLRDARQILVESVDMGDLLQDDVADGGIEAADAMGDRDESMSEAD
ncbi:RTC4-like domain-containing protein [Plectosphaerella cucumerina]|uniref:Restriction of telomere capping protein 4 n=1 Tax=Plectosphaerella cucumerina TaxID=40658 RepID=A0A8K0TVY7_9PEZI|nr:RTC4-like domain-containing protein [Plectosphaerella cucumerina]